MADQEGSVQVSLEAVCRQLQQRVSDDAFTIAVLRARLDQVETDLRAAPSPGGS